MKGSVLLLSLWSMIILSLFAVTLANSMFRQIDFAAYVRDRVRMRYIASAGIRRAVLELKKDKEEDDNEPPAYDAWTETWANDEEIFKEILLDHGEFTVSYIKNAGGENESIVYGIQDEQAKLNINRADSSILANLLYRIGEVSFSEAEDMAAAIIDWRDTDGGISEGGAEEEYYISLMPSYSCKNADFETVEELLFVKDINYELFSKIRGCITVYGNGKVNINTAPEKVLIGLGLSKELAGKVADFREEEDEGFFEKVSSVATKLSLSTEEQLKFSNITGLISVDSSVFRIISTAVLPGKKRALTIEAVVNRDGNIESWKEL